LNCKRCGQCCTYYDKEGKRKVCRFLVRIGSNITACRIYPNRLGTEIDEGVYCGKVEGRAFDYEGCPFNTNKPKDDGKLVIKRS